MKDILYYIWAGFVIGFLLGNIYELDKYLRRH